MPASSVPGPDFGDVVPTSMVSGNEAALRLLSALTRLTAAMPVGAGSRIDIALAGDVVTEAIPGIDLMATWLLGQDVLIIRSRSSRLRAGSDRISLTVTADEQETLAAGPLISPTRDGAGAGAELLNRLRAALHVRTLVLLPVNQSDKAIFGALAFGSVANRPFTRVEIAFLEAVAAQIARRLEAERGRRRAEDDRARLAAVFETVPEALIMVDRSGRLVSASNAARSLLEESAGVALLGIAPDATPGGGKPAPPFHRSPIGRALAGETIHAQELALPAVEGHERAALVSAGPLHDSDGTITGAVLLVQDVTALKELGRLKDEFINTVSHELRTPTTTIRGGALTLLRREAMLSDDVRRQLLQDIADESERLHHLVEDLLTLSRSRAGMRLVPEPLRLHRVVSKVLHDLGGRLGNHRLLVHVPPDLPLADADPAALEQVLRNLVENAARHAPSGSGVEISASARPHDLLVSVRDHGPGIPTEDRERVFEPFARLPRSVQAATQGAGLGLAVCRRLVEMAGGQIWAESHPQGGAVFSFTVALTGEADEP